MGKINRWPSLAWLDLRYWYNSAIGVDNKNYSTTGTLRAGVGTLTSLNTSAIKTDTTTPTDLTITTGAAKTLVLATSTYDDLQFQVSNAKVTPTTEGDCWE